MDDDPQQVRIPLSSISLLIARIVKHFMFQTLATEKELFASGIYWITVLQEYLCVYRVKKKMNDDTSCCCNKRLCTVSNFFLVHLQQFYLVGNILLANTVIL